jgi:hypothetical protein
MANKINPFSHEYFIGYINQVLPQFVKVHFPSSVLLSGFTHQGEEFNGGLVGNFVVIEGDHYGFLGRLVELSLPEKERLSLSEKSFQTKDFHPEGKIEILLSFDLYNPHIVKKGLSSYPNVGAKVYVCSSSLVKQFMSRFGTKDNHEVNPVMLGRLVSNLSTEVNINLQSLLSRHCAVVGTTGGGKSYTVSKIIELLSSSNKSIIIDATGEYADFRKQPNCVNIEVGKDDYFHYKNLSIEDLLVLLKPSGQVQQPILLEAIQSLKIVHLATVNKKIPAEVSDGVYIKAKKPKKPYVDLYNEFSTEIEKPKANFDINKLTRQLRRECVYDSNDYGNDITHWGDLDKRKWDNSTSLFLRTETLIQSVHFKKIFGFDKESSDDRDLVTIINQFLTDSTKTVLRINFENVVFDFQAREVLANAIGNHLLELARNGTFNSMKDSTKQPLVLIIDEAHQFLNKKVGDEFFGSNLDSFDSIAKECRKHGLFLCIATQMPRDIPQGTLSQMGTFIVHRLINHFDKEAISNACSSANRNTLDFLPILGEGEAILTGVDFPMPIMLKIDEPTVKPDSGTPKLS